MVAEDSTGRQGEISQLSTVRLNLDFVDWGFVNLGAVVTAKLLDHPELTPREYVTFLLANAYFYAYALRVGADEDTIHYTRGEFMRYPPIKKISLLDKKKLLRLIVVIPWNWRFPMTSFRRLRKVSETLRERCLPCRFSWMKMQWRFFTDRGMCLNWISEEKRFWHFHLCVHLNIYKQDILYQNSTRSGNNFLMQRERIGDI